MYMSSVGETQGVHGGYGEGDLVPVVIKVEGEDPRPKLSSSELQSVRVQVLD